MVEPIESEIRHLRLVTAIAESGSVTKAAEALHLTQSALSHQLRTLESRLNTKLFHRVGKRMVPTLSGAQLVQSATDVIAIMSRAERGIRRAATGLDASLRLTTECYTCYHWLPPVLRQYRARHPRVDVRIDASATNDPIKGILDGRLDLAVMSSRVRDRRLAVHPIFEDEMFVIVEPAHPFASRPFVAPQDFRSETLLLYPPLEESTIYQRLLVPAGVRPAAIQQVPLTEAIVQLVAAGVGIAVLARWAVAPFVRDGSIRAVKLTKGGYRRQWSAVTLREMTLKTYVRDFVDMLAQVSPKASRRQDPAPLTQLARR